MTVSLTPAQKRVMEWLNGGWQTEPGSGTAILVNGKRVCNVDTMVALEKLGLVERVSDMPCSSNGRWRAL